MRIVPNRTVIMEQAHIYLREHQARVASLEAAGQRWFGKPVTLAECIHRAWNAAKQEKFYAERGYNLDSLFYCTIEESHEIRPRRRHALRMERMALCEISELAPWTGPGDFCSVSADSARQSEEESKTAGA